MKAEDVKVGMRVRCKHRRYGFIKYNEVAKVERLESGGFMKLSTFDTAVYSPSNFEPAEACGFYSNAKCKHCAPPYTVGHKLCDISMRDTCYGCANFTSKDAPKPQTRPFKKGDRVRCVKHDNYTKDEGVEIGETYVLSWVDDNLVSVKGGKHDYVLQPCCFELVDGPHAASGDLGDDSAYYLKMCEDAVRNYTEISATDIIRDLIIDSRGDKMNEEIEKQLGIKQVGTENGNVILEDGRIGTLISKSITIDIDDDELKAIIEHKLPKTITDRAMTIAGIRYEFNTHYFEENKPETEEPTED